MFASTRSNISAPTVKTVGSTKSAGSRKAAGLNLHKPGSNNPNPIQHGAMGQGERAFSAASIFLSGVMAISASQFIGAPLKLVDPKFYNAYMAWTKESFAVLVTTMTQWWAPTLVRVSGDESMKGQIYQMEDGTLKCNFPHRLVLMANHQLYTDWLYLWWIAYTNKMHGHIYIILKESLKSLPIFGWGAQFYNFIFLSRKWETDKWRFKRALSHLKDPKNPMWLLIFPEGTNLSGVTREKSAAWAKKNGIMDMKNQLLPRTTGLKFCLSELRESTNWLYDCTIAYEGVPKGQYGQDVFTLRSSFFEGRPPKSVNMFWRRYKISEIPLDNDMVFNRWLTNRWREKDYILEYFYKFGSFAADEALKALAATEGKRKPNHAKMISTEVKAGGWDEFLSIFGPLTTAAGALGQVDLTEPMNFDKLLEKVAFQQHFNLRNLTASNLPATSQEAIRNALRSANAQKALPKSVMDKLMKDTPQTQEGMRKVLTQANAIAKPTNARSENGSVASEPRRVVTKAVNKTKPSRPEANSSLPAKTMHSPALAVKKAMPMANVETMITRPLSTMAMQTAVNTIRNVATPKKAWNRIETPTKTQTEGTTDNESKGVDTAKSSRLRNAKLTKANLQKVDVAHGEKAMSVPGRSAIPSAMRPSIGSKSLGQKHVNSVSVR
ncbi:acyltransferase-domain-containing protein [Acrodontium crateriforme]|uniref:Acyltransferase-domain-containing protein n=1 Tax=Acrodontium crateriforme TaxID=150365 RepID=A0AAQ3R768_9PEZI|nr:acyltransferase-domain-containing protein [Acrodontium crateriforme]